MWKPCTLLIPTPTFHSMFIYCFLSLHDTLWWHIRIISNFKLTQYLMWLCTHTICTCSFIERMFWRWCWLCVQFWWCFVLLLKLNWKKITFPLFGYVAFGCDIVRTTLQCWLRKVDWLCSYIVWSHLCFRMHEISFG